ncbi:hypothetical protein CTKA_00404 [Chthonomonas calidirosea]|uniref:Uncharacterized protein n=1 Tax=Chthonomonas calidirosea (strain DSM 23976 / ICMP 18418 / T49) TaxID=1303518 RepID=S0ET30_CHTCT|nr:hypothetical protein CCALI_00751 [Chthonomonas calidirosea T49]CEK13179.1 hypothetical protein CP488_00401 [Chthonomonas calidirosea]CEK14388.1 hypothetical protein CTKA_00404 [Chthonomonas calidirosea]
MLFNAKARGTHRNWGLNWLSHNNTPSHKNQATYNLRDIVTPTNRISYLLV